MFLEKILGKRHTILFQYRVLMVLLALFYPLWYFVLDNFTDTSGDSLVQRSALAGIFLFALGMSFKFVKLQKRIYEIYSLLLWTLTAHSIYLYAENSFDPAYSLSTLLVIFVSGNTIMTTRSLSLYYGFASLGTFYLAYTNNSSHTLLAFAGVISCYFISFVSLQGRLSILHNLRQSKDEIAKKADEIESTAKELSEINRKLDSLVNSLGQAFLIFDESGQCSNIYSKACLKILECDPQHKNVTEVLKIPEDEKTGFIDWVSMVFEEPIPFDELIDMAPQVYDHSGGRIIPLQFFPVRNTEGQITDIVLVATDKTDEIKANEAAEKERKNAKMINKIILQKKAFREFLMLIKNYTKIFNETLSKDAPDHNVVEEYMRYLHTIKGSAGMFFMDDFGEAVHVLEDAWSETENVSDLQKEMNRKKMLEEVGQIYERFFNFVDEHERILGAGTVSEERIIELPLSRLKETTQFAVKHDTPDVVVDRLVDLIKEPIIESLLQYSHLVVELGNQQGKAILPINFVNGDFQIVPEPFTEVFNTMVHIFRNAVDHGIEEFDERDDLGKDFQSRMNINIISPVDGDSARFRMVIEDDGRGINPEIIREKLKEKGAEDLAAETDDHKVIQHIFSKAFSTKEEVTELSGRGVGLDAVKDSVAKVGGSVWVESEVGVGSKFIIDLPDLSAQIIFSEEPAKKNVA